MFAQMKGSLAGAEGGLGMGLALVKWLVEMHGGRVDARSAGPGLGADFVVRLPVSEWSTSAESNENATDVELPAPRDPRSRILVADDHRDAATSLATLPQLDGHEIRVSNDGTQALSAAEAFRPHVALLDIGMPTLNGYEVARQIRAASWGREMTLVAVTGWGQADDRRMAQEAGFDRHVTKPLDLEALGEILSARLPRIAGPVRGFPQRPVPPAHFRWHGNAADPSSGIAKAERRGHDRHPMGSSTTMVPIHACSNDACALQNT